MKTIAITMDDDTLDLLRELTKLSPQALNRSALIRQAVREFAEREKRRASEADEDAIFRRHSTRLNRQAKALAKDQARP
jgi:metal-responsive CopG/Arc/MetJ family transcriptional regulator